VGRGDIDWPAIRADYVEGVTDPDDRSKVTWLSLEQIADRNGVNAPNLRRRASEEAWVDARALYQQRVANERSEHRIAEMARLGADLDLSALRIARTGMLIVGRRLAEIGDDASKRSEQRADSSATGPLPPPANAEEVGALARAANHWYGLGTQALGDVPRVDVNVSGGVELDVNVDATMRDSRTLGVMAILADAGALPPELREMFAAAGAAPEAIEAPEPDEMPVIEA